VRIATSTNLISFNRDGSKTEMVHLLPLYAKEGFQVLDLNLCEMLNPQASLAGENWKEYVQLLGNLKYQHTLIFNQAHAPYSRSGEIPEEMLRRSLEICHLLSIPILVVHPIRGTVEENHTAYRPYLTLAEEYHVILAFENLNEDGELTEISDLIGLVEGFASPYAGICYDTGHAHMCGHDLPKDIMLMGNRLVATHVADNKGKSDEHLLPFYGTIDWDAVLAALGKITYQGDLTYECMFFNQHLPLQLKVQAIRQAKRIGDFLLSRVP
jgi:sugar phosphate isomerase/epimerase